MRSLLLGLVLCLGAFLAACAPLQVDYSADQLPTDTVIAASQVIEIESSLMPPAPNVTSLPMAVASETPLIPTPTSSVTPDPRIRLLFSGQIVPARCVQASVDEKGNADYIYDNVRDLISAADLAVATVNGTISDFTPKTGCVRTFMLLGSSIQADAIANAGFDAASVATNHIKNCPLANCGERAFDDTLQNLKRVGVVPIGAGKNLAEALQPAVFNIRGVRFAIVSLGEIEPSAFAGENHPGIAVLNEDNLRAAIAAARQVGDVVIVMPHWGPEYSPAPNWNQRKYAQIAVEAGADLVVGNHPHTVQAIQMISGVPVFYGLGNFVFDQFWSLQTRGSILLEVTFIGSQYQDYALIPVVSDINGLVTIANRAEAAEILGLIEEGGQYLQ